MARAVLFLILTTKPSTYSYLGDVIDNAYVYMSLDVYVTSMWVPKDAGRRVRVPGDKIIGIVSWKLNSHSLEELQSLELSLQSIEADFKMFIMYFLIKIK